MNNNYYNLENYERNFSQNVNNRQQTTIINQYSNTSNLLKSKIGKHANIYTSFPDSIEWRDKIFSGQILAVGDDYTLIKDNSNMDQLIINIYINYVEFK